MAQCSSLHLVGGADRVAHPSQGTRFFDPSIGLLLSSLVQWVTDQTSAVRGEMGKKRRATVTPAAAAPVFPFPAADEPRHLSDDDDDDPRLRCFFSLSHSQATAKRPPATRRHHHQHQPPAMESARFKLQKTISKKHHNKKQQQQRRRWWSSALLFFKHRGSSSSYATATVDPSSYRTNVSSQVGPLYLAVEDDDDGAAAACACWAPAMWSGHLAASELGASASVLPYVSLRDSAGGAVGGGARAPPAMPIYLVT